MVEQIGLPEEILSGQRICDHCASIFFEEKDIFAYFSDTSWLYGQEIKTDYVYPHELYCPDCYPGEIPVPHLGTNEGFSLVELEQVGDDEYYFSEIGAVVGSPKNQGVEWDPPDLIEEFHMAVSKYNIVVTPMHTFSLFLRLGIDLRSFIADDHIHIPESTREQIKTLIPIARARLFQKITPILE